MTYKKVAKVATNFHCIKCDYITDKKCDYEKHLQTIKHKNETILINDTQNVANKIFSCNCGKIYKHSQSLYNHKKKCNFNNNDNLVNDSNTKISEEQKIDYKYKLSTLSLIVYLFTCITDYLL